MGAALHLAHVHQAPVKKRRPKRTGGGDGSKFAEIAHRIYQDERADTQARQLLLATAYAVTMAALDEETTVWRAICNAIGSSVRGWDDLRSCVRQDVPRYEPPGRWSRSNVLDQRCRGPRVRVHPNGPDDFRNKMKICGEKTHDMVVEKDPVTGWHTNHWFCTRHQDHLKRVAAQIAEQNAAAPPPVPNRGGLLPSYFESEWTELYRWATHNPTWEPPAVYGVRADDWPIPGQDPVPQRARLRLVVGNLGTAGDDA
ncbi:hypothetical protein [Streptomyces sp. Wb2n-11]|uniref:hypothetical protein n=1 Tax=Streptomyces sp. Wb2n-11 TaxID=1030533 RepID=UPI000B336EE9|nr:hypothetical protein [Streptomyces sp. Wb2n-11]